MKAITIILLALGCGQIVRGATDWVDVTDKVAVRIESVLYEKEDDPNFFIHVELRNQVPYEIGVDLSDKRRTLYPNQAGASDLDHREVIDERFVSPKELDAPASARLNEAFKSKQLTIIPAGKSVDYYTKFNSTWGRKELLASKGKFILLSIRGQLCFTDGSSTWEVHPNRDLAIAKPVTWKTVPANALVIER